MQIPILIHEGSLLNAGAQYEDAVDEYEPQSRHYFQFVTQTNKAVMVSIIANASALIASMEGPVQATILQFLQRLYLVHPSLQYALMEDMLAALTLWRSSSSDLDSSAILEGEDDPISGMRKRKRVSSPKPTRPTKRIKGVTAGEGPPEDSEDESSSQPPIADEVWETMFEDVRVLFSFTATFVENNTDELPSGDCLCDRGGRIGCCGPPCEYFHSLYHYD